MFSEPNPNSAEASPLWVPAPAPFPAHRGGAVPDQAAEVRVQRWAARRSRVLEHTCLRKGKGLSRGEWMTQRTLRPHLGRNMDRRACWRGSMNSIHKSHGGKSLPKLEAPGIP